MRHIHVKVQRRGGSLLTTQLYFPGSSGAPTATTGRFERGDPQATSSRAEADGAWTSTSVSLDQFAGQTVRIVVEAADAGSASLVDAAVDRVRVIGQ